MNIETTELTSLGKEEEIIKVGIKRGRKGLMITAQVHPVVEEMFEGLSQGEFNNANTHGRLWTTLDGNPLPTLYALGALAGIGGGVFQCEGGRYRLDQLGAQLYYPPTPGLNDHATVVMSFLRFRGISKKPISFVVRGVYSVEAIKAMRTLMLAASKQIYLDLIKPVDVVIKVTSQEIPMEG